MVELLVAQRAAIWEASSGDGPAVFVISGAGMREVSLED